MRQDEYNQGMERAMQRMHDDHMELRARLLRLRIAHLRRMLSSLPGAVERMKWFSAHTEAEYDRKKWRRRDQFTRFGEAINVEIARLRGEG